MKGNIRYWITLIVLLASMHLLAQEVQFTVDAPAKVEHGAQFRLTFSINQDGEFAGPKFDDFQLLGGPSVGTSTSMQIINGRTNSTTKKSYTYYLKASKIGKFKLPIATVKVKGKIYKSVPLSIEVIKSANPQTTSRQSTVTNPKFKPDGIVFVRSHVNKRSVFVGEPIILTQKLYSKERVSNITDFKEPTYTNFWKESIDIGELKLTREVINGQAYNVVIIQKSILFPQRGGNLIIGSFTLDAIVQIVKKRKARDQFEKMMYGSVIQYYANEEVKLQSPKIKIKVKELPNNKPQGFNGIVGNFKLKAEVDKTELKTNDAFNLSIRISGKGNVDLLEIGKIEFPPDFEVYDPKVSKSSKNTTSGVAGSKSYDYLIIPRNEGEFTIPAISFSYFNPQTERYENCTSKEFKINVLRGEGVTYSSAATSVVNRDEIKYVGKDVRYIAVNSNELQEIDSHRFNSWEHIITLALSPFIALFIILFIKKQEKKRNNTSLMRLKKATKMAKKRLKTANQLLESQNQDKFYEETSKALLGYISDKFNLNLSDLSIDNIQSILTEKNVDSDAVNEFTSIIQLCEFARYAPSNDKHSMTSIYNRAIEIISIIEKTLK